MLISEPLKEVDPYLEDAGIAVPAEDEKFNPYHSPTTGEFSSGGGGAGAGHPVGSVPYEEGHPGDMSQASKILFGKELNEEEWKKMVGAPPGSTLKIDYADYKSNAKKSEDMASIKVMVKGGGIEDMGLYYSASGSGKKSIYIDVLSLGKTGTGEGTRITQSIIEEGRVKGFTEISLTAAKGYNPQANIYFNGQYTWARLGWNADAPKNNPFGAKDLNELMSTKEGRNYWKEKAGGNRLTNLKMKFDLNPNSTSSKIFDAYIKAKR